MEEHKKTRTESSSHMTTPDNEQSEARSPVEESNGTKRWYCNGVLHREDGPAIEWPDGAKSWYSHGKRHREDGPAIEQRNGDKYWFSHGKMHREDGPAAEQRDGDKYWFSHGKLHREDGPAVELRDGTRYWYSGGKLHREDGPAIERPDGTKEWFRDGWPMTGERFDQALIKLGLRLLSLVFAAAVVTNIAVNVRNPAKPDAPPQSSKAFKPAAQAPAPRP